MAEQQDRIKKLVAAHSVLVGITPIIPIPLLDDLVKTYFQRRMVRKIAAEYGVSLDNKAVPILADDASNGCIKGCLSMIFIYPFKKIFRKIFFFLEWKRAISTVSSSYHQGILLSMAFEDQVYANTANIDAQKVREAMDATCKEVGVDPINRAVRYTFEQSKDNLKKLARLLQRNLPKFSGQPDEEEINVTKELLEKEEEASGISTQLDQVIHQIPPSYFENLRAKFKQHLTKTPQNKS